MRRLVLAALAACSAIAPAAASPNDASSTTASSAAAQISTSGIRNGREIFSSFLEGRADPGCDRAHSDTRWEEHFSRAPARLADDAQDILPLFGYVVDELRKADMPTEFALIPFVESGYRPGARNGSGPAGLWQFIATTARNHHVPVGAQYDGRLSAVDSTTAAVRYLKTLYGMFGGDWRLALMAYNAGEYRVLQAMRSAGMNAQNARPSELPGMSKVTYEYVEKLHALACVLNHA
ncbi:lytic transglycosylase, partial [Xanthomonas oryzae pv. oryzae]